jgi:hypothetical protein
MPRHSPVQHAIYTLRQIEENLKLLDSPHLMINCGVDGFHPIQTSHFIMSDLFSMPEWAESKWEYQYTTNEWIPVFYAVNSMSLYELLSIAQSQSEFANDGDMWIVPLLFPREEI